jgi:hypothetical protein
MGPARWRLINLRCLVLTKKSLFSLQTIYVRNYVQNRPLSVCKQADAHPHTADPLSCSDVTPTNNNEQLVEWLPATRRRLLTRIAQTHVIVDSYVVQFTPSSVTHPRTIYSASSCVFTALSRELIVTTACTRLHVHMIVVTYSGTSRARVKIYSYPYKGLGSS